MSSPSVFDLSKCQFPYLRNKGINTQLSEATGIKEQCKAPSPFLAHRCLISATVPSWGSQTSPIMARL